MKWKAARKSSNSSERHFVKGNRNRRASITRKVVLGGLAFIALDMTIGWILQSFVNRALRKHQADIWDTAASLSADDDL